ncbi:hypothetical protein C8J56DRAFT_965741, partial [Mycena floridula]
LGLSLRVFLISISTNAKPKTPPQRRKGARGVAVKINDDSPACPELGSERARNVMANSPNGQEATVKRWNSLISVNTLFQ